jgi:DNA-binding transcriptional LysR family regulator
VLPCLIGSADPTLTRILPQIHIKRSFWIATHCDTRNLPQVRHFVDWLVALTSENRDLLYG